MKANVTIEGQEKKTDDIIQIIHFFKKYITSVLDVMEDKINIQKDRYITNSDNKGMQKRHKNANTIYPMEESSS